MDYRLYKPEDFAALYAIEKLCFEPPRRFGRIFMRRLILHQRVATWIAEDAAVMRGFGIVVWSVESGAYVQTLEVLPEARGRGIAAELLRRLEGSAAAAGAGMIRLHVDAENAPAVRVYERAGYLLREREQNYYGRGRAGLAYEKALGAAAAGIGQPSG